MSAGSRRSKTSIGSDTYRATRRHAVTNAGGTSYGYNVDGNMSSRGSATIRWSSYNLPAGINSTDG